MSCLLESDTCRFSVQIGDQAISIDLVRSPKSMRLLEAFACAKERSVHRADLHTQLTRSKYNPVLHDARLFKLVQRLEQRLVDSGFPKLWHWQGDSKLVLRQRIQVI